MRCITDELCDIVPCQQATKQHVLSQVYTDEEACLKVVFERIINLLRHGVVPVFIIEGTSPAQKQELQKRRCAAAAAKVELQAAC